MTDIKQLTDILRQFAEHKCQQAESHEKWAPGKLILPSRIRRLQLEAQALIGYADEIEEWYLKDPKIEERKALLIKMGKESYKELGGISNKHARVIRGLMELIEGMA